MSQTKKIPVWLDCDPGHDDIMAILLAGHNEKLNLIGVSCCFGNQSIEKTTYNAISMMDISGLSHIPVFRGAERPLLRELVVCGEIHGESGLDGTNNIPKPTSTPVTEEVYYKMYQIIKKSEEKVIIITTGAMTNIAILFKAFPDVKNNIAQISSMGGSIGEGNWTSQAEWNILIDPEAAQIVLNSGLTNAIIPIEVTHTALCTKEIQERINKLQTKYSETIIQLLTFFAKTYKEVFHFDYPPLHDPCAVAYIINPTIFQGEWVNINVECNSKYCDGRLIINHYESSNEKPKLIKEGKQAPPKNVFLTKKMDFYKFWDLQVEAIEKANSKSKIN